MKVKITVESTDMNGEVMRSSANALLEDRTNDYKISYVEALSDSDRKTRTIMYVTSTSVRIIRDGEVKSDFMYAEGLTHNSLYKTMYGDFPVSVVTKRFSFLGNKMTTSEDLFESFPGVKSNSSSVNMEIDIEYELIIEGSGAMDMRVRISVSQAAL